MKKLIIMTALLVASSVAARAEFYVGASLTSSGADLDEIFDGFDRIDDDDMGWKAYVGWNFHKFLGVEAGYRDLGTLGATLSSENGEGGTIGGAVDIDVTVFDASARAFLPIGKLFNIYAKAGYANIRLGATGSVEGETIESGSEDDWELFYGIGSEFNIGKNFAIRAEWEMYDDEADLNTLSAGVIFRF